MKKTKTYILFFVIMLISFYYTNKIAILAKNSNPIMKNINETKEELAVSSINAEIVDEYIIPGLNGKEVNVNKSFNNMRPYNIFNEYYIIYKQVKPKISLDDNKNKIIIQGNPVKNQLSIILNYNKDYINYLNDYNIPFSVLITKNNYNSNYNMINNDNKYFEDLDKKLTKDKLNNKICLINDSIIDKCKKNNYYLIKPSIINNNTFLDYKNIIKKGSIIYIKDDLSYEQLNMIINYINSKGINIVYINELISEINK